jgi:hypothetical protein
VDAWAESDIFILNLSLWINHLDLTLTIDKLNNKVSKLARLSLQNSKQKCAFINAKETSRTRNT